MLYYLIRIDDATGEVMLSGEPPSPSLRDQIKNADSMSKAQKRAIPETRKRYFVVARDDLPNYGISMPPNRKVP